MTGFVYFAQRGGGVIKVGASWNPIVRVSALRGKSPTLRLIGVIDEQHARENEVHKMLAPHRIVGEWYWPRDEVWAVIGTLLAAHGINRPRHEFTERFLPRLTRGAELLIPEAA